MQTAFEAESAARSLQGKITCDWQSRKAKQNRFFLKKLEAAVHGDHVIYVISEPEHIDLLPVGAIKVLVTADLDTIKERFRARMHGNLPVPIEKMLERNHGCFDSVAADYHYDGVHGDPDSLCSQILNCNEQ